MIWHNDMTWWHVNRIDGWGWEEGGRGGGEEGRGIVGIVVEKIVVGEIVIEIVGNILQTNNL